MEAEETDDLDIVNRNSQSFCKWLEHSMVGPKWNQKIDTKVCQKLLEQNCTANVIIEKWRNNEYDELFKDVKGNTYYDKTYFMRKVIEKTLITIILKIYELLKQFQFEKCIELINIFPHSKDANDENNELIQFDNNKYDLNALYNKQSSSYYNDDNQYPDFLFLFDIKHYKNMDKQPEYSSYRYETIIFNIIDDMINKRDKLNDNARDKLFVIFKLCLLKCNRNKIDRLIFYNQISCYAGRADSFGMSLIEYISDIYKINKHNKNNDIGKDMTKLFEILLETNINIHKVTVRVCGNKYSTFYWKWHIIHIIPFNWYKILIPKYINNIYDINGNNLFDTEFKFEPNDPEFLYQQYPFKYALITNLCSNMLQSKVKLNGSSSYNKYVKTVYKKIIENNNYENKLNILKTLIINYNINVNKYDDNKPILFNIIEYNIIIAKYQNLMIEYNQEIVEWIKLFIMNGFDLNNQYIPKTKQTKNDVDNDDDDDRKNRDNESNKGGINIFDFLKDVLKISDVKLLNEINNTLLKRYYPHKIENYNRNIQNEINTIKQYFNLDISNILIEYYLQMRCIQ